MLGRPSFFDTLGEALISPFRSATASVVGRAGLLPDLKKTERPANATLFPGYLLKKSWNHKMADALKQAGHEVEECHLHRNWGSNFDDLKKELEHLIAHHKDRRECFFGFSHGGKYALLLAYTIETLQRMHRGEIGPQDVDPELSDFINRMVKDVTPEKLEGFLDRFSLSDVILAGSPLNMIMDDDGGVPLGLRAVYNFSSADHAYLQRVAKKFMIQSNLQARLTVIYSKNDGIVSEAASDIPDILKDRGGEIQKIEVGSTHLSMMYDPQVVAAVLAVLEQEADEPTPDASVLGLWAQVLSRSPYFEEVQRAKAGMRRLGAQLDVLHRTLEGKG